MRPFRTVVILSALCVLCGWLLGQATTRTSGAQEAETSPPADEPQVWVEVIFIQVDTADLDRAKANTGATLRIVAWERSFMGATVRIVALHHGCHMGATFRIVALNIMGVPRITL